jgi:hypothetical protein
MIDLDCRSRIGGGGVRAARRIQMIDNNPSKLGLGACDRSRISAVIHILIGQQSNDTCFHSQFHLCKLPQHRNFNAITL